MIYPITQTKISDIDEVMRIEEACFVPGIREARSVFIDRINTFPDGNLILLRTNDTENARRACAGYFCSELWNKIPTDRPEAWSLGHSAKARHTDRGEILYISSFAIDPSFRGKGTGRFFFQESLGLICWANPGIRKIAFIVNEAWQSARHIYETEGFVYTAQLDRFFVTEDRIETCALIMEKVI